MTEIAVPHELRQVTTAEYRIKARFPLSLADAWIAASALKLDAVLVHKDPEFERVGDLKQELLPYK